MIYESVKLCATIENNNDSYYAYLYRYRCT